MKYTRIDSKVDKVSKFIFDGNIEAVYVDNNSGKDIICLPSQTGCKLGCEFCYLTFREDKKVRNITTAETIEMVTTIINQMGIDFSRRLHFSFMGSGEPFLSLHQLKEKLDALASLCIEMSTFEEERVTVGFSSILPKGTTIESILVKDTKAYIGKGSYIHTYKLHWSLHNTIEEERQKQMPNALSIEESVKLLKQYVDRNYWKELLEIHYTINATNSSVKHALLLADIAKELKCSVKFLKFSVLPDKRIEAATEQREKDFIEVLEYQKVPFEIYTPPGHDILAACGEFVV